MFRRRRPTSLFRSDRRRPGPNRTGTGAKQRGAACLELNSSAWVLVELVAGVGGVELRFGEWSDGFGQAQRREQALGVLRIVAEQVVDQTAVATDHDDQRQGIERVVRRGKAR